MARLTGQTKYRLGWGRKVILQVGIWARKVTPGRLPRQEDWYVAWQDATFEDVIALAEGKIDPNAPKVDCMPPPPRPRAPHCTVM